MDASVDGGVDGRWMSYAELAELRQIDKTSALKLALRRKWTRRKDNHGTMQVCVPLEWLQPPERQRDMGMDAGVDLSTAIEAIREQAGAAQAAYAVALSAKDGQIAALQDRVEGLHAELQRALQAADAASLALDEVRAGGRLARAWRAWKAAT